MLISKSYNIDGDKDNDELMMMILIMGMVMDISFTLNDDDGVNAEMTTMIETNIKVCRPDQHDYGDGDDGDNY